MDDTIFLSFYAIFLTAQTAMLYAQSKQIAKMTTALSTLCREHRTNHGGDQINV